MRKHKFSTFHKNKTVKLHLLYTSNIPAECCENATTYYIDCKPDAFSTVEVFYDTNISHSFVKIRSSRQNCKLTHKVLGSRTVKPAKFATNLLKICVQQHRQKEI